MSTPTPPPKDQPSTPSPAGPLPRRMAFLILPLTIFLVWNSVELLLLAFSGEQNIREAYKLASTMMGTTLPPLTTEQIRLTLWLTFAFLAGLILWLFNTRRGLLEGKSWGRVSAIIIAVCSLLVFPIGTVLGVFMLIGAFDRDVTNYTSRK